jgi:hypothetical protein
MEHVKVSKVLFQLNHFFLRSYLFYVLLQKYLTETKRFELFFCFFFISPCEGYECQDFADCVDKSTPIDPIPTCVCQLGRYYDKVMDF